MKKYEKMLAFVLLVLAAVLLGATALAEPTVKNPMAIDLLIAIDNSQANKGLNGDKSKAVDPNGIRFDAAAALIWMCDTEYSRANYFLFDDSLYTTDGKGETKKAEPKEITLFNMSTAQNGNMRTLLNRELTGKKFTATDRAVPDYGKALQAAVDAQLTNPSENKKVIVMITSGHKINDKEKYERIINTAKAAKKKAEDNGIEIYIISFNKDAAADLQDIATERAKYKVVSNETELVNVFQNYYADMIGSAEENKLIPVKMEGTENTYTVRIPILNKSVLETNIIIPVRQDKDSTSQIDRNSVELFSGQTHQELVKADTLSAGTNKKLFQADSDSFTMIKMVNPDPNGVWTVQFKSETDPKNIQLYMLYSYDISLKADVKVNGSSVKEVNKGDDIVIESYFVNHNGERADDTSLYRNHAGEEGVEDWWTIQGSYELYRANGTEPIGEAVRQKTPMDSNTASGYFEGRLNVLTDGNPLPSGEYVLVVSAEGAGLKRETRIPIKINNQAPVVERGETEKEVWVNKTEGENKADTWKVQANVFLVNANDIVKDPDGDKLEFELKPITNLGDDHKNVTLSLNKDTGIISYTTTTWKDDSGKERANYGEFYYTLEYNDGDNNGKGETQIVLTIRSQDDEINANYELELKADGEKNGDDSSFKKNTPVTIKAFVKNSNNGQYEGKHILQQIREDGGFTVTDSSGKNLADGCEILLNEEEKCWEITIEDSGNTANEWDVTAEFGSLKANYSIHIPNNNPPVLTAEAKKNQDGITIHTNGEKVPTFLRPLFGTNTEEDAEIRKFSIENLFTDKDGDRLTSDGPIFQTEDGSAPLKEGMIWTEPAGKKGLILEDHPEYTIQVSGESTKPFSDSFTGKMVIIAKDGDGQECRYELTIKVVDLYNQMLTKLIMVAAAIAALVILILIIRQIRKPKFPMLNVTIREEPSLYDTSSSTLSPVKKPTNVNAAGVDSEIAAKHSISMELLQNVIIKPIRSRTAVGVVCRKMVGGHEVSLNDVRLKTKKLYTWQIGQELSVKNINGEGAVVLKLDSPINEEPDPSFSNEYGEWQIDDGSQKNTPRRKLGWSKQRRTQASEDQTQESNSDDF